jgi:hypothetical protein
MKKLLTDNLVVLAVLGVLFLVYKKFGSLLGLDGVGSAQKSADYGLHAQHLIRPPKLRAGAPLAEQKAYAAKLQLYSAAVLASRLATNLDNSKFILQWTRKASVQADLNLMTEQKVPFNLVQAEYRLARPGRQLLDDLRELLDESSMRLFLSRVTRS